DGIRDFHVTGVQTCALPISKSGAPMASRMPGAERFVEPGPLGPALADASAVPATPAGPQRAPGRPMSVRQIAKAEGISRKQAREIGRASCRERVESRRGDRE